MEIDGDRLLADLRELAGFGRCGRGVHRPFLSQADRDARDWLVQRMRAAARRPPTGRQRYCATADRALLIGSHTDSVPRGGWLDGALGVIYGLEIARARSESGEPGSLGVDVVSFADEESAYLGMAGSRAFCGYLSDAEIDAARHEEGRSLREALTEATPGVPWSGSIPPGTSPIWRLTSSRDRGWRPRRGGSAWSARSSASAASGSASRAGRITRAPPPCICAGTRAAP
jgi:hypothetical protein